MRRGAKPTKAKVRAKLAVARKARTKEGSRDHQLETRLAEALEEQAATSEILRVISSSPADVQPVFAAVAANAARLCDAFDATIFQIDTDGLRVAAHEGPIPAHPVGQGPSLVRGTPPGRAVLDRRTIHVPDVQAEIDEYPEGSANARRFGHRTVLVVPLLRAGEAIGAIAVRRAEVRPFHDKQIALLQTFADQAVIAIENVRLFNETKEALEQQTATSEILSVISSSPTDVAPVFQTILSSSNRLCEASFSVLWLWDGEALIPAAHANVSPELAEHLRTSRARPRRSGSPVALTALEQTVIHVPDVLDDSRFSPADVPSYRLGGARSILSVPMLREGSLVGVINTWRREPRAFTDKQVELLKTFADQAVIAIENVRLFNELQGKNAALTEAHAQVTKALEQQTATSEILRVISSSPTNIQPVLEAVTESAARLCDALDASIFRVEANELRLAAHHGPLPYHAPVGEATIQLHRGSVNGRAVIDRQAIHVADLQAAAEEFPEGAAAARRLDWRTALSVPLLREGVAVGVIAIRRAEVRAFTDKQIELLQTFADQAVIAIENVRLFTELDARNRDLTEALAQQTATAEVLRVIGSSPTDVQPVFDAIAESALRLLRGRGALVARFDGHLLHAAAFRGGSPGSDDALRQRFPMPASRGEFVGEVLLDRAVKQIADVETDEVPAGLRANARVRGWRANLGVPMLHDGQPIGVLTVSRAEPGAFSPQEVELLKTFADQAVIAIENVRLFKELEARTQELTRSVDELRALGEVGQAISSTLDLQTVLSTIVARATQLTGVDAGVIYEYDEQREVFEPRATERLEEDIVRMLVATPVRKGQGVTGRLAEVPEPIQVADVHDIAEQIPVRDVLVRAGYRALLSVPLVREDRLIGGLTVFRKRPGEFAPATVDLLRTFATQSALAIQNARLFREIADKSRQLEVASQHKSEFLANMSHELRTPLNAIIGFSEVLSERMFGDLNEKQEEYLKDIYASGTHLLSLINDILDLSKIEAGRMELELTDFDLPQAIDNALTLVRERAGRRGIALHQSVEARLGEIRGDERKVKQVLLNLLSNALKFTPEGGRVEVLGRVVNGMAEISVTDTGVGIPPEDQEAVFEEFRQVGTAEKKAEGTGLGLALCRKFVELHGGRIWVKSEVGSGSTFSFTLPVRYHQ